MHIRGVPWENLSYSGPQELENAAPSKRGDRHEQSTQSQDERTPQCHKEILCGRQLQLLHT